MNRLPSSGGSAHDPGGGPNARSSQKVASASGRMMAKKTSCRFSKRAPRRRSSQRGVGDRVQADRD